VVLPALHRHTIAENPTETFFTQTNVGNSTASVLQNNCL
jgi:hypothetical protein